jgi:hypothetical protein
VKPLVFEGMVWDLASILGTDKWIWLVQDTYVHFYTAQETIIYKCIRDADYKRGITWELELVNEEESCQA